MKNTLLIVISVLAVFVSDSVLRAQILWEHKVNYQWVNPETQESDSDITFTSIAKYKKSITAAAVSSFPSVHPYRMTFYRSNDDGLTWFEQSPTVPFHLSLTNQGLTNLQQIDSLHVVGTGELGVVYMTSDAGATWYRRDLPAKRNIQDVHFYDVNTGIIVATRPDTTTRDSVVFTTTDGGLNWIAHKSFTDYYSSCYSYGEGKFRIFRYDFGHIITTNDNFASVDTTFMIIDSSVYVPKRFVFRGCSFEAGDTLFAYGNYWPEGTDLYNSYSAIIRSTDDGITWDKPFVFKNDTLSQIWNISSPLRDTIFAGGTFLNYYLISTDRGASWRADTMSYDIPYDQITACKGMLLSESGHPIAIYGRFPLAVYSCIWRGKYVTNRTPIAHTLSYRTKLYPNPSAGRFIVELKGPSRLPVTITDMLGRVIAKGRMSDDGRAEFDLSDKPRGIYYITLTFDGNEYMVGKVALTID